ncbi:SusC/RagA family TonB-linked outer membrane protein [Siphonobacter curvatus]|uniref:TonB-dependent receptor n=1 Tax=Siphonobacter curvatus TaxID=2094562 RepID=A0A2S7IHN2_9BACT|nr:SusC/RagA family TonB-linked outer membrane protein [Siphonobacter curvatus]PQA55499.1 TonB-dependent receptor [Siphonobacter curvatus]
MKKRITFLYGLPAFMYLCGPPGVQAQEIVRAGQEQVREASASGQSLEHRLQEVEKQYKVSILYNPELVSKKRVKDFRKYTSLEQTLEQLLKPYGLTFKKVSDSFYIVSEEKKSNTSAVNLLPNKFVPLENLTNLSRSERISATSLTMPMMAALTVQGKVSDATTGEPLPGVNVVVKNTSQGVTTNRSGEYSLPNVPENAVLVFSSIGYQAQEMAVQNRSQINISLTSSSQELDQVVVVGYSQQRRSTLTGSVAQIGADQLKQAPPLNVSNVLAGRLPGVIVTQPYGQPGADNATINVRGISTTGSNAPLVIVDGIERPFTALDPNEIETVSVLKDASAAAVYGARAANGVILITTKRGKTGKPTITYETNFSQNTNTRFPKFLNGPDYMRWYKRAEELDNQYLVSQGKTPFALTYTDEEIASLANGTNQSEFLGNTDWVGMLTNNTSVSQYHNVSVNGGTDRVRYFTTLGYWNQNGVIKNTNYKRYNVRTNIDADVNDFISTRLDLTVRMEDRMNPALAPTDQNYQNPFILAQRMQPNLPMFNPAGLPVGGNTDAGVGNPIVAVNDIGNRNAEATTFNGNLSMNVKIPGVQGLQARLLVSYDKTITEVKTFVEPAMLAVRNRNANGWLWTPARMSAYNVNNLIQDYSHSYRTTFQPSILYDRTFGKNAFNGLLLYEYSGWGTNGFGAQARNFPITDLLDINFGSKAAEDLRAATGSSTQYKRGGYVGRVNYTYDDKYLFEVAARYDASVNFPESTRWGFFPSASLGWVLSKENFWQPLNTPINFFKVRLSAGKLGNDYLSSAFPYLNSFQLRTTPTVAIGNQVVSTLYNTAPANPTITWEEATMYNGGVELGLWNSNLSLELDYFYKVTSNILTGQSGIFAPSVGGNFASAVNAGKVDNRGVDLQLAYSKKHNKLSYKIIGNFTYAHNRVLRINESVNAPAAQRRVGHPVNTKFGFVVDGLYQTQEEVDRGPSFPYGPGAPGYVKYVDLNGDGKISFEQDVTRIGRSNTPEIMYGLNLQAGYGPFDFSALLQGAARSNVILAGVYNSGVQGNTVYTQTFAGNGNSPYFLVEDSWRPDNPNAKYPRLTANKAGLTNQNGYQNSFFVRDGSYLRLKSLQIGYSLPKDFLSRLKIQQWRFYAAGSNLLTFDKIKYADPETPSVVQAGFYPQQRVFSIGTNITF